MKVRAVMASVAVLVVVSGCGDGGTSTSSSGATGATLTPTPTASPTTAAATTSASAPSTNVPSTTAPVAADAPIAPASVSFSLPKGFEYPEGIAVDPTSGRAYVTARDTGAVAVAEPGADTASVWLPGGTDGRRLTFGIEFDRDSVWLVSPPAIWEYGTDGELRGHHVADGSGFLNDLAVTDDGIYVTDSANPVLWFLSRDSAADAPLMPLDLTMVQDVIGGPAVLNGIEALDDGTLVAGHVMNGMLFHIEHSPPNSVMSIESIDLGGHLLPMSDGMSARGSVLWISAGAEDAVNRVTLCPSHSCGTVMAGTPDPALSFPTDVELRGDDLLVVNSQFDNGGGLGDGIPTTPFTISAISITG